MGLLLGDKMKREWVGLTDAEMVDIVAETDWGELLWEVVCLTKIIEATLKEKNDERRRRSL